MTIEQQGGYLALVYQMLNYLTLKPHFTFYKNGVDDIQEQREKYVEVCISRMDFALTSPLIQMYADVLNLDEKEIRQEIYLKNYNHLHKYILCQSHLIEKQSKQS